jgi:hypothetical protein
MVWLEGLGKLKKLNYLIGTRNRDLWACNIAPQLSFNRRADYFIGNMIFCHFIEEREEV